MYTNDAVASPVAGALVTATDAADDTFSATTDANGTYELDGLPAERHGAERDGNRDSERDGDSQKRGRQSFAPAHGPPQPPVQRNE